jgi:transposase
LDIKAGTVIGRCQRRHRSIEFRAFLDTIEASVPADADVHVVLDDAATHKTRIVQDWLIKRPRFHLHFTPTSASWLNLVECWFALLTRRRLELPTPQIPNRSPGPRALMPSSPASPASASEP